MGLYDDSDKTVADFDTEAYFKEQEKKKAESDKKEDISNFDDIDIDGIKDDELFDDSLTMENDLDNILEESPKKSTRRGGGVNTPTPDLSEFDDSSDKTQIMGSDLSGLIENDGDKTQLVDLSSFQEEEDKVEYAKLLVVSGADSIEHVMIEESITIGRTENNQFTIPNNTVSRNHCKVSREQAGFFAEDLKSGNGIKVNGKKTPRTQLKSGDIITLGKVKIQFIDLITPGVAASTSTPQNQQSAPVKTKKGSNKMIFLIVAVVLIAIAGGVFVFMQKQNQKKKAAQEEAKREAVAKKKKQIATFFNKGVTSYKNKEWNSAIDNFNLVLKLKPNFGEAKSYLKSSTEEKERFELIKKSKNDLINEDFKGAILKLSKIPDTSVYYTEAQDNINIADKKFKKYQLGLAQKNFDEENYQTAKDIVAELLKSHPDLKEALELQTSIEEKLITQKEDKKDKNNGKKTNLTFRKPVHKVRTNHSKGLQYYQNKQFDNAIAFFKDKKDKKSKQYLENIQLVKKHYNAGKVALKGKKTNSGIASFNKALAADRKVESKLASYIKKDLSTLQAMKAKSFFNDKKYAKAYKSSSRALKNNGSNGEAKTIKKAIDKKTKEMYLNAYMLEARNPDKAKKIYKQILSILPASNPTALKAKKRLK